MKTVSTKLDSKLHDQFIEICNEAGKCQSEMIRYLIEVMCEDLEGENILHIEEVKSIPELKEPKVEIIYDE